MAIDGFAELGAGQNGGVGALGDFLSFPLGEHSQQVKEHPTSGGAGVDGLAQGNEIGVMLFEVIGKVLQFASVAGQAGQFGEDEARDVAALDIFHHAFGFGMLHDGLAALPGKVIHFLDLPKERAVCAALSLGTPRALWPDSAASVFPANAS